MRRKFFGGNEGRRLCRANPKMQTSNDLIRENYGWPMTAGQVSKLTGVTTRALQHYDEKGLLCPRRSGEGVANNRKLYSPEDVPTGSSRSWCSAPMDSSSRICRRFSMARGA